MKTQWPKLGTDTLLKKIYTWHINMKSCLTCWAIINFKTMRYHYTECEF